MKTSPSVEEIKNWLREENPLGLFSRQKFFVKDIDPKPWSGHFNYLVQVSKKKFVLRFKGGEWGKAKTGVANEFKILKAVEKYNVGPKVYYLAKNFFGEPMMLEEYLEGKLLNKLSYTKQKIEFPRAAKFIARLNRIPFKKNLPYQESLISYQRSRRSWKRRLAVILKNEETRPWGERIKKFMPQAEKMIDQFESRLRRVLKKSRSAFIFESSHIGHLLNTESGFRFFNWEQVSFGDPSFTLAVFLASISSHSNFEKIKKEMIHVYLKENYVPEFRKLVEQRLKEREVSNLLWTLWAYCSRGDFYSLGRNRGVLDRFERVERILKDFKTLDYKKS